MHIYLIARSFEACIWFPFNKNGSPKFRMRLRAFKVLFQFYSQRNELLRIGDRIKGKKMKKNFFSINKLKNI